MRYRSYLIAGLALLFLSIGTLLAAQAAQKSAVPPFTVTAKKMVAEITREPKHLAYSGDVKFVSPIRHTVMTCQRLDAYLKAGANDISRLEAHDGVVFTMVNDGADKGSAGMKVTGTAETMIYEQVGDVHVLRMLRVKDVLPTLTMTDPKTGDHVAGGDITGNEIRYTVETGILEADDAKTENKGVAP